MYIHLRFAQHLNFLGPLKTDDGKPYGPILYKSLIQECYMISRFTHITYDEAMNMTPVERNYISEFLREEVNQRKQAEQKALEENNH